MRVIFEILKVVLGVVAGAALIVFVNTNFHLYGNQAGKQASTLSYADLAAINLTVATVVLGGVALIVAIVAVFGFQVIRSESVSNAEKRVKEELPTMLGKELKRMERDGRLSQAMERVIYSGGSQEDFPDHEEYENEQEVR